MSKEIINRERMLVHAYHQYHHSDCEYCEEERKFAIINRRIVHQVLTNDKVI